MSKNAPKMTIAVKYSAVHSATAHTQRIFATDSKRNLTTVIKHLNVVATYARIIDA